MLEDHLQLAEGSIKRARELQSLDELAANMFTLFFARYPEAEQCFNGFDMKAVAPFKFCKVSDALIDVLKYPDYARSSVSEEVFRHQVHDVRDKEYYFALAESFVETIKSALAGDWTPRHDECWNDTLGGLKHNVYLAAEEHLPGGESKRQAGAL